ncbi:hypothetical protein HOP50_15g74730 [Chloropicon primus]|uniref:Coiled-coil domain-containing protein 22 homolog n=1 Tax=Chloropicon primus TaxID=1764295 RepID=A0A5B8MZG2_9CHLO|nr:hypothetical protein A3770_15p74480 [Chloropicon primus]UPR04139.1 hypothetical protein HOP50_15g74730 [Chloropicon primus]|eukprot:QDZ24930.1 hypothetical protein A3770_15p74480 [Chloropicon primus]
MAGLEEADGALFAALRQQGLESASTLPSLKKIGPDEVYGICAESVKQIIPNTSIPLTLTPNPSDRFRACTGLTNEIKAIGYKFDLGFQQILYPTEKEVRQLLVFLISNFPKAKGQQLQADCAENEEQSLHGKVGNALRRALKLAEKTSEERDEYESAELRPSFTSSFWYGWEGAGPDDLVRLKGAEKQQLVDYLVERSAFERACGNAGRFTLRDLPLSLSEEALREIGNKLQAQDANAMQASSAASTIQARSKSTASSLEFGVYGSRASSGDGARESGGRQGSEAASGASDRTSGEEETSEEKKKESIADIRKRELGELHRQLVGLNQRCADLRESMESKLQSIKATEKEILDLQSKVKDLSGQHSVWKEAVAIAVQANKGGDLETSLGVLQDEISALEADMKRSHEEWLELKNPVLQEIERMRSIDVQKKQRREKIARDTVEMKNKIKRLQIDLRHRKNEKQVLQQDYKNADKTLNRYTYVERIGEIIKNVKKQEVEIERILVDTFQVQRDINSAEESLHRAYTLADETIFREARSSKSVASKDLYQLLSSMHSNFAQVVENIRAIGKMERESQDCIRKTEELLRTPFEEKIQQARRDLSNLNNEIARLEAQGERVKE